MRVGKKVIIGTLATAAIVAALVFAFAGLGARGGDPPVFRGSVGQFTLIRPLRPAPVTTLLDADGGGFDFSRFRGKVVLVNFWATWCGPCVREMPALDRLQGALGGPDFIVAALSIDRRGKAVAEPFLRSLGIRHLALYLDPKSAAFRAFGGRGLPTSYLLDREGRVVGYLEGPAEWDSEAAKALMRHYMAPPKGGEGRS